MPIALFEAMSVVPSDGVTTRTVGGTTSRTGTVSVAVAWLPAASVAVAVSVNVPPVGSGASNGTTNVSVRGVAAGPPWFSERTTTPVLLNATDTTPLSSAALTLTCNDARGSIDEFAGGPTMEICGGAVSRAASVCAIAPPITATVTVALAIPPCVVVAVTVTLPAGTIANA